MQDRRWIKQDRSDIAPTLQGCPSPSRIRPGSSRRTRSTGREIAHGNHKVYINGSLKQTIPSPTGSFYDKFGAYRTASGNGPITVEWSNVRFWQK
jgi:hypothetical protein